MRAKLFEEAPHRLDDAPGVRGGQLREHGQRQGLPRGGLRDRKRAGLHAERGVRGLQMDRGRVVDAVADAAAAQILGQRVAAVGPDRVKVKDRLYIGEGKRDQVKYIRSKISFSDLTSYAKDVLEEVVNEAVAKDEKRFVDFFNKSIALTTRMHSLELLPGIGKKHLWQILGERKKKPFESFDELHSRIPMLTDPRRMVIRRIMEELQEKDRHQLFVSGVV